MSTPELSNLEASIFVSDCHYLGGLKFMVDMKKPPRHGNAELPGLADCPFLGCFEIEIPCRFSEERSPFIKGFLTFGSWFSRFFPTIPICWGSREVHCDEFPRNLKETHPKNQPPIPPQKKRNSIFPNFLGNLSILIDIIPRRKSHFFLKQMGPKSSKSSDNPYNSL